MHEAGLIAPDEVEVAVALPVDNFDAAITSKRTGHPFRHHEVRLAPVGDVAEPAAHGVRENAAFRAGYGEAIGARVGDTARSLGRISPFDDATRQRAAPRATGPEPFAVALR